MGKVREIPIGTKIGRLVVIGTGEPVWRYNQWNGTTIVQCQCQNKTIKTLLTTTLTKKGRKILSCGCLVHEPHVKPEDKHVPLSDGKYRYVYVPNSPNARKKGGYKGYMYEHRFVMEKILGRPLTNDEHVHHIDFNGLNNEPSNLMILSNSEHSRLHMKLRLLHLKKGLSREKIIEIIKDSSPVGVAHLEERVPPKNQAAGSTPVTHTNFNAALAHSDRATVF